MFKKFFKYTPTIQESQFIDIVEDLLNHPKTTVKMTPLTDKFFIINEQKHYYVLLKEGGIQVTNTRFTFSKPIHPKAYEMIINKVYAWIENDRNILEDQIFQKETKMLEEVKLKLQII